MVLCIGAAQKRRRRQMPVNLFHFSAADLPSYRSFELRMNQRTDELVDELCPERAFLLATARERFCLFRYRLKNE